METLEQIEAIREKRNWQKLNRLDYETKAKLQELFKERVFEAKDYRDFWCQANRILKPYFPTTLHPEEEIKILSEAGMEACLLFFIDCRII